jgi:hypothetical protein
VMVVVRQRNQGRMPLHAPSLARARVPLRRRDGLALIPAALTYG